MIETKLVIEDKCHECPYFDVKVDVMRSADFTKRLIYVGCSNEGICEHIERYLDKRNFMKETEEKK